MPENSLNIEEAAVTAWEGERTACEVCAGLIEPGDDVALSDYGEALPIHEECA